MARNILVVPVVATSLCLGAPVEPPSAVGACEEAFGCIVSGPGQGGEALRQGLPVAGARQRGRSQRSVAGSGTSLGTSSLQLQVRVLYGYMFPTQSQWWVPPGFRPLEIFRLLDLAMDNTMPALQGRRDKSDTDIRAVFDKISSEEILYICFEKDVAWRAGFESSVPRCLRRIVRRCRPALPTPIESGRT